ncbi:unnamed protein product [Prunus brigantina]
MTYFSLFLTLRTMFVLSCGCMSLWFHNVCSSPLSLFQILSLSAAVFVFWPALRSLFFRSESNHIKNVNFGQIFCEIHVILCAWVRTAVLFIDFQSLSTFGFYLISFNSIVLFCFQVFFKNKIKSENFHKIKKIFSFSLSLVFICLCHFPIL